MSDCYNGAIESVCVESTDHEALVAAGVGLVFIWCVVLWKIDNDVSGEVWCEALDPGFPILGLPHLLLNAQPHQ